MHISYEHMTKFLKFQQLLKCILRASSCLGGAIWVRPLYFSALQVFKWKREFSDTNSEIRKTLLMFWLNASVFIRVKLMKTFNIYSYMYTLLKLCHWLSLEVKGQWWLLFPFHVSSSMWSVPVEALLCECHLYVQGLLQQYFFLSSGTVQHRVLSLQTPVVIHWLGSNFPQLFLTDLQLL